MKKQTLLLLAGGLLTIASCTSEAGGGYTQEQVDSAVNARVAEMQAAMQASNDSAIQSLAQIKADSMIAAMKGAPVPPKSTTKAPPKTTTPTAPVQTAPPPKAKDDVTDRKNSNNNDVTDRNNSGNKKTDNDVTNRR